MAVILQAGFLCVGRTVVCYHSTSEAYCFTMLSGNDTLSLPESRFPYSFLIGTNRMKSGSSTRYM